jgi:hypothetical protein
LERNGLNVPVATHLDAGTPMLTVGPDGSAALTPRLMPAGW